MINAKVVTFIIIVGIAKRPFKDWGKTWTLSKTILSIVNISLWVAPYLTLEWVTRWYSFYGIIYVMSFVKSLNIAYQISQ